MPEPLRIVDPNTGELRLPGCDNCSSLSAKVEGLQNDLDALMSQLATVVRQRDALKREKDEARRNHPKRAQVVELYEHWVERTGKKNSKLSADRFDAAKARLNEGYTVDEIKLAIDGAAAFPYIVNAQRSAEGTGVKRNDLELICRGGRRLEELAVLGHMWRRQA